MSSFVTEATIRGPVVVMPDAPLVAPAHVVADSDVHADADFPAPPAPDPLVPAPDPLVPALEDLDLATILQALSDPIRLQIVVELSDGGEHTCSSFTLPVAKSTCSHHFRVLREAGVVAQRVEGKCRFNRLRSEQLEQRFPGLLGAVLQASDA